MSKKIGPPLMGVGSLILIASLITGGIADSTKHPDTASRYWLLAVVGALILVIGIIVFFMQKRS